MAKWDYYEAAHLLRRAGFGGSAQQVLDLHALGREDAIASLLNYESINDPAPYNVTQFAFDTTKSSEAIAVLLYRMLTTSRPLQEKLTWFWHNHFTSAFSKCPAVLMMSQNETWRRYASGNFLDFLLAMYKDPAMLVYLDNNTNVVGRPNENFAREVMELFTLGIGNYSETDIKEAARALTGWKVQDNAAVFNDRKHDNSSKTILGVSGNLNGDDLMAILFSQPATARHICSRLYRFFVQPEVPESDLAALVSTCITSGGNIKAVMNTLLHLDSFWSPQCRNALVKSPVEYALGLIQRLGIPVDKDLVKNLAYSLSTMGQQPFNPPDVSGYPDRLEWAGTSLLLSRYNFANSLISKTYPQPLLTLVERYRLDVSSAGKAADILFLLMGPLTPTAATHQAVVDYLNTPRFPATAAEVTTKAQGALHLITSSVEYQLN